MATSRSGRSGRGEHPFRGLVALVIVLAALFGIVTLQNVVGGKDGDRWVPKLGLDLEGGTQIVLEPRLERGQRVTPQELTQAVDIIQQRVDGSGVAEPEITTEGGRNIVVAVPGTISAAQQRLIEQSSQLTFRPVLLAEPVGAAAPTATSSGTPSGAATSTPSSTATGKRTGKPTSTKSSAGDALPRALTQSATTTPAASGTTAGGSSGTASPSGGATPSTSPTDASDPTQVTPSLQSQYQAETCTDLGTLQGTPSDPTKPLVTCGAGSKYVLGPVEISGKDVKNAVAGLRPTANGQGTTNEWEVNLTFDGAGTKQFGATTTRLFGLQASDPTRNRFAIVLDGLVVSAPGVDSPITNGQAAIYGSFDQSSATALANQLKYGALPLSFSVQTTQSISPLLGNEQLQRGLLAGLIGLVLVVLYSLFQYRALSFVTVLSLAIAAVSTFVLVVLLGNAQGLRLTLAGVTGLIVSIGVTADSFIVYFERVRDEVREGRSLRSAVQIGWGRARRTILAADAINFLAAVVLYVLAAGSVRGFAFTLGLTTLIDVLIVFLFTHPMLTLLARTRFFGQGHRFSGLDPERLGKTTSPIGVKNALGTIASRRAAREAQTHQEV